MKKKNVFSRAAALAVSAVVIAAGMSDFPASGSSEALVSAEDVELNYAKALQYSMYFYDANMCGTEVSENSQFKWRGDCHVYDAKLPLDSENTNMTDSFISANKDVLDPDGDGCLDVAGGFHDAGDHVKFGLPEGYSGAAVGWGYYEFRESYEATGQAEHAETILRYFNDYFMKSTYLDEDGKAIAFCYQVGDGDIDHKYWNSPEVDEMPRKGWFATDEMLATDCISIAASSLAINYLNFKDTDPDYAKENLKYAKALFEFADRAPKKSVNNDGPKHYYESKKWEDDYCFAAMWLFMATEDKEYVDKTLQYVDYYAPSCWTFCWNDVWAGVVCLLGEADEKYGKEITNDVGVKSTEFIEKFKTLQNKSPYEEVEWWSQIKKTIKNWKEGITGKVSPGGYTFLSEWGSARYNTATQFLAYVYDKYNGDKATECSEWAKSQMDYLLGENPLNRCYVVGYSDISAKYPHHRAASGLSKCEDTGKQRYVLYGALVGGPDVTDNHIDVTSDWIYNEVTIDYNAAFVGACAGSYHFFGDDSMKVTPDFPPEDVYTPDDGGEGTDSKGDKYWIEGFCVDVEQSDGPKASEITFYVCSNVTKPSKKISVRYYFDSTGMSSIGENDIELRQLYDQTAAETDSAASISKPIQYKDKIYYIEVSWDDYVIANSNKKYQFALGTYAWGNSWDPTDDWSHKDIKQETDAFKGTVEKTPYICVYDDGVLVGGIEPDGTVPDNSAPATTKKPDETTKPVTTKKPAETTKSVTTKKPAETTKPVTTKKPAETTELVTTKKQAVTTVTTKSEKDTPVSNPADTKGIYGDLDDSGKVDITDLTTLSLYLLGDIKLDEKHIKLADVNGDGKTGLPDLAHLKQYIMSDPVTLGPVTKK